MRPPWTATRYGTRSNGSYTDTGSSARAQRIHRHDSSTFPARQTESIHVPLRNHASPPPGGARRLHERSGRRRTRCRPRPGHPLSAATRRQLVAHRLRARQRPVDRGSRGRQRGPAHQLRGRGDRSGVQRRRTVDRLLRPVRRQHRRVRGACRGRAAGTTHLASGPGCRPGLDPGGRDPLSVESGSTADDGLEVLHRSTGRRAAGATRATASVPGGDVRGRRPHRLPGDRVLRPRMAQLPGRPGAAGKHRLNVHLGAGDGALGGRAPYGSNMDGRCRLLPVRARLGEQRLVVRIRARRWSGSSPVTRTST